MFPKKLENDILSLYRRYPELAYVERAIDHKFEERRHVLELVPKLGCGAELGVYTGTFSEFIVSVTNPRRFFMVDPWWKAYGDTFPDWGQYTAHGRLQTRAAYEAAALRASNLDNAEIVVERSVDWLRSIPDDFLDWVYLDSTHDYQETLDELYTLIPKLKSDGVVAGDDCWTEREYIDHGVFRAIRDFTRWEDFEIIYIGYEGQWALRRNMDAIIAADSGPARAKVDACRSKGRSKRRRSARKSVKTRSAR
jgi:Methyltransferase domain